jgi:SAM-dependent methyltransferase
LARQASRRRISSKRLGLKNALERVPLQQFRNEMRSHTIQVRPYSRLADCYDVLTGRAAFLHTRQRFEALVRHYGIDFRSAVDVGCGTGLFACYLSRRWRIPVFGIDSSPEMLAGAACNCPDRAVSFLLQDMRSFSLPCPVDLATANAYTFNHLMNLCDLRRAIQSIHANLSQQGVLIFDLISDHQAAALRWPVRRRLRLAGRKILHQIRWDPSRKLLSISIVHSSTGPLPPRSELYVGRGYSTLDVGRCLQDCGFMVRGIHDADTLAPISKFSPHAFVVAYKK